MTDPFRLKSTSRDNRFGLVSQRKMRSGFNDLIDNHPQFLIYIRRDFNFPHGDCFLSDTNSPDPSCSTCFGTGYKVQYEKHKCRRVAGVRFDLNQLEQHGWSHRNQTLIYTPRYYYPKVHDIYIEADWNVEPNQIESVGKPTSIFKIYKIDDSISIVENEVTYFMSTVTPYEFNLATLEQWLLTIQKTWTEKVVN